MRLGSYKREEITRSEEVLGAHDEISAEEIKKLLEKHKGKYNLRFELDYETNVHFGPGGASEYDTYFLIICWSDLETDEEAAERVIKNRDL